MTLSEEGNSPVSLTVAGSRNISLVPGRSFNIKCNRDGGFGGATEVWLRGDTPVQDRTGETIAPTTPSVHTIMMDSNNWILVLQLFQESDVGAYTCRGTTSSVTLVIRTGKSWRGDVCVCVSVCVCGSSGYN